MFLSNQSILRIDRWNVTSIDLRVGEGICDFIVFMCHINCTISLTETAVFSGQMR